VLDLTFSHKTGMQLLYQLDMLVAFYNCKYLSLSVFIITDGKQPEHNLNKPNQNSEIIKN